jgi:hypothetical protein
MNHKVGWHMGNTVPISQNSWKILGYVPPAAITFITGEKITSDDMKRILDISPECHFFYRPYFAPSDKPWHYQSYIEAICSMLDTGNASYWEFVPEPQRHLQLWNEQNMPRWSQWEGFGDTVEDMLRFNEWFCKGYHQVKEVNPTFKIGYTPLTPGNRDVFFPYSPDPEGIPYYMHGPEASKPGPTEAEIRAAILSGPCYEALSLADEYYAHIYVINDAANQMHELAYGCRFVQYARFFPKLMDIWIPENGIGGDGENWKLWYQLLNHYPEVKGTSIWRLEFEVRDPGSSMVQALKQWVETPQPEPEPEPEPEPGPDPGELTLILRHTAWNEAGISYNPEAAFALYARDWELGAPITNEMDIIVGGVLYRLQGYMEGIVYAEVDKWDQIDYIVW